jgi:hypothetical protein
MQNLEKISAVLELNSATLQIKLDILDVYLGYRKGARIICRLESQLESIVKVLLDINIKVSVGKGLVFQKKGLNNVVDFFENDTLDAEKLIPIYISLNDDYANLLREADESRDDIKFGTMLDYPACCIKKVAEAGNVPSIIESFHYLQENMKYNVWTWPVAMIGDASLLVHYPCSTKCSESMDIAKKHFQLIYKYAPKNIVERVEKYHSSFYTLNNEIICINENKGDISPLNDIYEIS